MPKVSIIKRRSFYLCKVWTNKVIIKYTFTRWGLAKSFGRYLCFILSTGRKVEPDSELWYEICREYRLLNIIDRNTYGGDVDVMG